MEIVILGRGPLGRAIEAALLDRGACVRVHGRPAGSAHDPAVVDGAAAVVEASVGEAVRVNVETALAGGARRLVLAATGWEHDRPAVEAALRDAGAAAVVAPNLSLGAALFLRLVEQATDLFGAVDDFDPYVVEWHRRGKRDRPSGTAREIAGRIAARHPRVRRVGEDVPDGPRPADELEVVGVRAGAWPGSHLVGFDAPGETVELRLTARDRSTYAAGALAAIDWLCAAPRPAGAHPFDRVVDDLLDTRRLAATA